MAQGDRESVQSYAVQKVRFGTHMLAEEANDWWIGLLPILEQDGVEVTWAVCNALVVILFTFG